MRTDGIWFKDDQDRTLLLRGANLSGATKVPYKPDGATYRSEGFFDHRNVSFVGRPFPLSEADEHFSRLREWGLTFLRFLVTWEAIEHSGPGQYDHEYLDYLYEVVKKANDYGISLFIDPHQDVWSRFTGGDGAPGWTLEAVGFDISKLSDVGGTIVHAVHGDPFPQMIWPTNYMKLGAATMFTLFFGGNDFAPRTRIDGIPVQEYLQSHYINAIKQVAKKLNGLPNVIGYDTLNEPGSGWIGIQNLTEVPPGLGRNGIAPTPLQAMAAGAGHIQKVEVWAMGSAWGLQGTTIMNPNQVVAWKGTDVWRENGVWTDEGEGGSPRILRPDHFAVVNGREVNFSRDYLKPFLLRYTREIRSVDPAALIFIESVPATHPVWGKDDPKGVVYGGHWYDVMTLISKHFDAGMTLDWETTQPIIGVDEVRESFGKQLGHVKQAATEDMSGIPTLIGEFGIPFDLDNKKAYQDGDFSTHVKALDAYYNAMDKNLLSCTIWNYTPDNTNERGDLWNDEDLSIFSRDQQTDPHDIHSGGRGLAAVVRPYARRTAGEPLRMHFDLTTHTFEFEFRHDPKLNTFTELFVPNYQYPDGYKVELSDGTYQVNQTAQSVIIHHTLDRETHTVRITPA